METLKVSTRSNPNAVAGAMAGVLRQDGAVEVQVVGAGALNQAIKAVAIARGYVTASGIDVVCVPNFADVEIDGERRTAIRLTVEDRSRSTSVDGEPAPDTGARSGPVIDLRSSGREERASPPPPSRIGGDPPVAAAPPSRPALVAAHHGARPEFAAGLAIPPLLS